ncbi:DUF1616 domain-containing protein [Chloroflexota bacterium]
MFNKLGKTEVVERDLLIIDVLTFILVLVVSISSSTWLRVLFGLPFILFFPGYTLIAALFPRKEGLSGIERLALSFGLSIAVVPLIGLILNYTWSIKLYPIVLSLGFFILAMSTYAWYKRRSYPTGNRFSVPFLYRQHLPSLKWQESSRWDKVLSVVLVISILGAIGTLAYVISTPKVEEKFTEFYILGLEGKVEHYPEELEVGEVGEVILGIVNQEHERMSYRVEVWIEEEQVDVWLDDAELEEIEVKDLPYEEKWEYEIGFTPQYVGGAQKVEFRLFKNGDSEPYSTLRLYVDIIST